MTVWKSMVLAGLLLSMPPAFSPDVKRRGARDRGSGAESRQHF
jgi:hypothetical protein